MWVRSEYAGELAVFSTWVCAFLPWSVTFFQQQLSTGQSLSAVWIRFTFGRFLYVFGLGFPGDSPYRWVWEVPDFVATRGERLASYVWLAGVAVFAVAFVFSVCYYLAEERVEALPVDPVRTLGALLVLAGVTLLAAAAILFDTQGGLLVPVGVLFQVGLGAILLRIERT